MQWPKLQYSFELYSSECVELSKRARNPVFFSHESIPLLENSLIFAFRGKNFLQNPMNLAFGWAITGGLMAELTVEKKIFFSSSRIGTCVFAFIHSLHKHLLTQMSMCWGWSGESISIPASGSPASGSEKQIIRIPQAGVMLGGTGTADSPGGMTAPCKYIQIPQQFLLFLNAIKSH